MAQNFFNSVNAAQQPIKAMNVEQFDQVVNAILEGKYSWACVLILRFAGYNPVHYIPYRTYKRLIKDNKKFRVGEPHMSGEISSTRNPVEEKLCVSPQKLLHDCDHD